MGAEQKSHVLRGIVCAAAGGTCWGFSGTCAQLLTSEYGIPVEWITCVRLLSGAAIFLSICLIKDAKSLFAAFRDRSSLLRIAAFGLFGVLFTQASYLSTISYTNAGTGTVLERLGLLVIMLYVCIRVRRLPNAREAIGLVLAIGGTILIATKGQFDTLIIPPEALFWGGCSAFALAFYTLLPVQVLKKWGSLIVTGIAMLISGTVAVTFVQPWTIPVAVNTNVIIVMALMVTLGTVCAYIFYLQGITDAGPVRAGLIGCIEPVSATVISAVWLGTVVSPVDIVGMVLILSMVFLVTSRKEESIGDQPTPYDGSHDDLPLFEGRASVLGYYRARKAAQDDFVHIRAILDTGHEAVRQLGINTRWKKYPSARRIMRAIERGACFVVETESAIIGAFAVSMDGDPHYNLPLDGVWLTEGGTSEIGYATLNWVTVAPEARHRGVGSYILGEADRIARDAGKISICADIYPGNVPMRELLLSHGYTACGTIRIKDYLEREKIREVFERVL